MVAYDFRADAERLRPSLIARRRDFHQHPEIAFEEVRTAAIVARELNTLGLEVRTGVGKTGVVALLEGAKPGKTILVRADMDALPIQEATGLDYASVIPDRMHACGHDGHTAIALAVAEMLAPLRDQIAGRIKFVFQPAEEIAAGAQAMIADGAIDDPVHDIMLGLHLWNNMPTGQVSITTGASMAGASKFTITITGKGTHAAIPHEGIDPMICAAQLVTALQTIVSREINPLATIVLSVTRITAGTAFNIIPQTATLEGTLRAFDSQLRDQVVVRMTTMIESICQAFRCQGSLAVAHLTEPVINDADVSAAIRPAVASIVGIVGSSRIGGRWRQRMSALHDRDAGGVSFRGRAG